MTEHVKGRNSSQFKTLFSGFDLFRPDVVEETEGDCKFSSGH